MLDFVQYFFCIYWGDLVIFILCFVKEMCYTGLWMLNHLCVVVVQLRTRVWLFVTPWTAARQASLSLAVSQSLPKFMAIASVMPSSHLIFWRPLLLVPLIFPSIRDFSSELAVHIKWPKYWSFSISPSNEYSGLISLKIYWFDLLVVQGTFRSLL